MSSPVCVYARKDKLTLSEIREASTRVHDSPFKCETMASRLSNRSNGRIVQQRAVTRGNHVYTMKNKWNRREESGKTGKSQENLDKPGAGWNKQEQGETSWHKLAQAETSRNSLEMFGTSWNSLDKTGLTETASNKPEQLGTTWNKLRQAGTSCTFQLSKNLNRVKQTGTSWN